MEQMDFISSVPKIACKMTKSPPISQEQDIVNRLFIFIESMLVVV